MKNLIKFIDQRVNRSRLLNWYGARLHSQHFQNYEKKYELRINGNYKIYSTYLAKLSSDFGTDKGGILSPSENYRSFCHTYTDIYEFLYGGMREHVSLVFECGIGSNSTEVIGNYRDWNERVAKQRNSAKLHKPGASLRMWEEYFPNAKIIGADIDPNCKVSTERISTGVLDQTNPKSIAAFWEEFNLVGFDLMIDDGLHTFEAGKCLFENSIEKLKVGGHYVIEDVVLSDLQSYSKYFENLPYNVYQLSMQRTNLGLASIHHNSMVIIQKNA